MRKLIFIIIIVISSTYLNAQTSDKEIKFGGRIMYDMAIWGPDNFENAGSEVRRVRLFSSGTMYQNVGYKLQLDFANKDVSWKDIFIQINKLPLTKGSLRIGHFKEPLRLEVLTSSKYITFMERSLSNTFLPERNSGVMYNTNISNKISLQAGVFSNGYNFGNELWNYNINVNGRITYLAINNENQLLHLGLASSKRKSSNHTYGFSTRAENHLGTKLLQPEFTDVDETNILGAEIAYVRNRLSLQGEYLRTTVSLNPEMELHSSEYELNGYYGQVSYFLTGESRLYKSSYEGFNRVKPKNNYGENGWGAFEIAARVSQIDLSSVENGTLDDITLGLNWYLNPNTRVMMNYVMGEMTNYQGEITQENAVMMRVQLDF